PGSWCYPATIPVIATSRCAEMRRCRVEAAAVARRGRARCPPMNLLGFISVVSALIAAVGLLVTARTLRANPDWNRRSFGAELVLQWNERTSAHRKAIKLYRPGLVDLRQGDIVEITRADAKGIYESRPNPGEIAPEWELRFHFIELLNFFSAVAAAYR